MTKSSAPPGISSATAQRYVARVEYVKPLPDQKGRNKISGSAALPWEPGSKQEGCA